MVRYLDTLWCDGCGIEIRWEPIQKGSLHFCCKECLAGEQCDCDQSEDDYPPGKLPADIIQSLINQ